MSVKITDNTPMIKFDMDVKTDLFLRFLLDEVEKNSDPLTPKKEGPLRQSTLKTTKGSNQFIRRGQIEWRKEYAAAQEAGTTRGYPIRHYTTPGTGKDYALRGAIKAVAASGALMRKVGLI